MKVFLVGLQSFRFFHFHAQAVLFIFFLFFLSVSIFFVFLFLGICCLATAVLAPVHLVSVSLLAWPEQQDLALAQNNRNKQEKPLKRDNRHNTHTHTSCGLAFKPKNYTTISMETFVAATSSTSQDQLNFLLVAWLIYLMAKELLWSIIIICQPKICIDYISAKCICQLIPLGIRRTNWKWTYQWTLFATAAATCHKMNLSRP